MTFRYFFILFFVTSHFGYGQLSIDQFLLSATSAPSVKSLNEQVKYLRNKPYRLSPLQRLEFRTQNQELQSDQQEYALRITPANPWEIRSNNRYFKAYESSLVYENQIILKEALLERYYCVIEYLYNKELLSHKLENQKLLNDQTLILEKQSGSSYFDADEYLDLQVDHLDVTVELEEIEVDLTDQANQIDRLYGHFNKDEPTWDVSQIIDIDRIRFVVDSISTTALVNMSIAYQQQQVDLANSEYKLEKSNINTGFIQTEYDNRRAEQGRTPINISVGFTIPITNPNKGDMTKRKLEVIEAQHELEEVENMQKNDKTILQQRLSRLIKRYDDLKGKMAGLQSSTLAGTLSTIKGGDPRFILRFQENQVKLKIVLAKIRREILIAYADYLSFSDNLQQQPLRNYLTNGLDEM
jgi:hypothetical protein